MHTTKRAVLLSCSDHYNHRLYVIDGYLKSQGYETVYYTGDFDHSSKKVFHCSVPGCRQIHVRPYRKNLSLARILSHRDFARLVFQELEQDPPVLQDTPQPSMPVVRACLPSFMKESNLAGN